MRPCSEARSHRVFPERARILESCWLRHGLSGSCSSRLRMEPFPFPHGTTMETAYSDILDGVLVLRMSSEIDRCSGKMSVHTCLSWKSNQSNRDQTPIMDPCKQIIQTLVRTAPMDAIPVPVMSCTTAFSSASLFRRPPFCRLLIAHFPRTRGIVIRPGPRPPPCSEPSLSGSVTSPAPV